MASNLPAIILALTHNFEAWIIGSAADPNENNPKDYDVVVPYSNWNDAAYIIPKDAKVNSFGGWKFDTLYNDNTISIDMWPGELSFLLTTHKARWIWQPRYNIRWYKVNSDQELPQRSSQS